MYVATEETTHVGTVLYDEKKNRKYLVVEVGDDYYTCINGWYFEPINIGKKWIKEYYDANDDKDINTIIASLKEGGESSEEHDSIISAEEARKISDDVNKNKDDKEIRLIAEMIRQACAEGDYQIKIYYDNKTLSPYLRDNTENILSNLGYEVCNEKACTFGMEYDLIISWERNS